MASARNRSDLIVDLLDELHDLRCTVGNNTAVASILIHAQEKVCISMQQISSRCDSGRRNRTLQDEPLHAWRVPQALQRGVPEAVSASVGQANKFWVVGDSHADAAWA